MNSQQAIIIILLTGLLLVILAVSFTAMETLLRDPVFIKYSLMASIILAWLMLIFVSDLYISQNKTKDDLKNYQKQNHESIMQNYIDASNAQCPA